MTSYDVTLGLYELLKIESTATDKDVERAHRRQALLYHPDVNKDERAVEMFHLIQQAYEVLIDTESRKKYDGMAAAKKAKDDRDKERDADVRAKREALDRREREGVEARKKAAGASTTVSHEHSRAKEKQLRDLDELFPNRKRRRVPTADELAAWLRKDEAAQPASRGAAPAPTDVRTALLDKHPHLVVEIFARFDAVPPEDPCLNVQQEERELIALLEAQA
ncbi:Pre-mRNA-splicing factor cwf23 [Diplonema papillatum]|nr:Pre-mRNA-splicing factor cwf23 [Diplonema papillatum]|eukprot:gene1386-2133_t